MFNALHHHSTLHRLRHLRLGVAVWLLICMSAALASPLLSPARYEVVCGASGKAHLVTHGEGKQAKDRQKSLHDMACALLCAASSPAPTARDAPALVLISQLLMSRASTPVHAVPATAAPPPARAPPLQVSLFFQQSSERSI